MKLVLRITESDYIYEIENEVKSGKPPWGQALVVPVTEISPAYAQSFLQMLSKASGLTPDKQGTFVKHSEYRLKCIHNTFKELSELYQDKIEEEKKK